MKMLRMILPAVAFVLAIVASVANASTKTAVVDGFPLNSCSSTAVSCVEDDDGVTCKNTSNQTLYYNIAGSCNTQIIGDRQ